MGKVRVRERRRGRRLRWRAESIVVECWLMEDKCILGLIEVRELKYVLVRLKGLTCASSDSRSLGQMADYIPVRR